MRAMSIRWETREKQTHYIDLFIDNFNVASYNKETDQLILKHASRNLLVHHEIKKFLREEKANAKKR
jgi:sRNA-binding regulator protein Hfq